MTVSLRAKFITSTHKCCSRCMYAAQNGEATEKVIIRKVIYTFFDVSKLYERPTLPKKT